MFVQACWSNRSARHSLLLAQLFRLSSVTQCVSSSQGHAGSRSNKLRPYLHSGGKNTPFQICLTSPFLPEKFFDTCKQDKLSTLLWRDFSGCTGLCFDSKWSCSSLSNKTGPSSTSCLFESYWGKPGVASVHRPNVVWGVYHRVQNTGARRSVL